MKHQNFDPHSCMEVALRGEKERGSDGVVWYDILDGTILYIKVSEVQPKELKETLEDMMSEDENKHFFVCVKETFEKVDIAKVEKSHFFSSSDMKGA